MGTRGNYGFVHKGKVYVMYNHYDSYPERPGLGWTLVHEILWANLERWKTALETIRVTSDEPAPTKKDIEALRESTDTNVDNGSLKNWYVLTRKNQGSAVRVLQSGYLHGTCRDLADDFAMDQGDWGYLMDFDKDTFRIWVLGEERPELGCRLSQISETMFDKAWIDSFNIMQRAKEEEDTKRKAEKEENEEDDEDTDSGEAEKQPAEHQSKTQTY
jgi:hypothetical protein